MLFPHPTPHITFQQLGKFYIFNLFLYNWLSKTLFLHLMAITFGWLPFINNLLDFSTCNRWAVCFTLKFAFSVLKYWRIVLFFLPAFYSLFAVPPQRFSIRVFIFFLIVYWRVLYIQVHFCHFQEKWSRCYWIRLVLQQFW